MGVLVDKVKWLTLIFSAIAVILWNIYFQFQSSYWSIFLLGMQIVPFIALLILSKKLIGLIKKKDYTAIIFLTIAGVGIVFSFFLPLFLFFLFFNGLQPFEQFIFSNILVWVIIFIPLFLAPITILLLIWSIAKKEFGIKFWMYMVLLFLLIFIFIFFGEFMYFVWELIL